MREHSLKCKKMLFFKIPGVVWSAGEQELTTGRPASAGAVCDAQPLMILLAAAAVQTSGQRSCDCRSVRRILSNETRLTVERASPGFLLLRRGARSLPVDPDDAQDSRLGSGGNDGRKVGGADGGLDAGLALKSRSVA